MTTAGTPARALVLGGGGVAGIAWEIGVLRGLEEEGVPVHDWRRVVGTSAGAIVGARILADPDLERWYTHEARPTSASEDELVRLLGGRAGAVALRSGRRRGLGWVPSAWLTALSLEAMVRWRARPPRALGDRSGDGNGQIPVAGPDPNLARLGAIARSARTAPPSAFVDVVRDVIAPAVSWPQELLVTVVDAADGSVLALDSTAGVPLDRAVAASAAVPVLFPPVGFLGRRWIDGGMASMTHASLAADADEVLIVAPLRTPALDDEVRGLRELGRRVDVIVPGPTASAVFGIGTGLLDPARRPAAARSGLDDGRRAAERLRRAPAAGTDAAA